MADVLGGLDCVVVESVSIPANDALCPYISIIVSDDSLQGVGVLLLLGCRLVCKVDVPICSCVGRDVHVRSCFFGHPG